MHNRDIQKLTFTTKNKFVTEFQYGQDLMTGYFILCAKTLKEERNRFEKGFLSFKA